MSEDIIKANRKKVWTNVTLRLDQETKLAIIERANSEGLNTNQFLAKIVTRYLSDSSVAYNSDMHDSLVDMVLSCRQRIGHLSALNADLTNKINAIQSESKTFEVTSDSFVFLPPDLAKKQAENEVIEDLERVEKKYNPKFKMNEGLIHDLGDDKEE